MPDAVRADPPLVAHLDERAPDDARSSQPAPARVGLVVSKAVGNAVTRNRVSRRLRHQMQTRVERLGPGSVLVLRAQPAAAAASSQTLGADLDRVLDRLLAAGDGSAGRDLRLHPGHEARR